MNLPALPDEDHLCQRCGLSYLHLSMDQATDAIRRLPGAVRESVSALPAEALRRRPADGRWSVAEYLCHLRDVYVTYTIRLHRARTEDRPSLEPMLNDLRARRFKYNQCNVNAVLDELSAAAAGFRDEVTRTRTEDWDRVVTRLPGEERTARWLVRQAMHEGQHHLDDIRSTRVVPVHLDGNGAPGDG